jgi:hypothetical protein
LAIRDAFDMPDRRGLKKRCICLECSSINEVSCLYSWFCGCAVARLHVQTSPVGEVGQHAEERAKEGILQAERPPADDTAAVVLLGVVSTVGDHGLDPRRRVCGGSSGGRVVLAGL